MLCKRKIINCLCFKQLQQQQQNQPQQNPPGPTPTQPQGSQIAQPQSASKQLTNSTTQLPAQKLTATTQLNATSVGVSITVTGTCQLKCFSLCQEMSC